MTATFKRAVRSKSKLRLGITGPSGSGKTLGALIIAKALAAAGNGRIAVIDSEKGSASLYASPLKLGNGETFYPPEFDVLELEAPYTPEKYRDAVKAASQAGYEVCIIDSMTHEWSGIGGCLELVDQIAQAKYRGNSWSAWNDVTPRHRDFIDTTLQTPMHIIGTMRSKTETAQIEENGRKKVAKLGMKSEQRDGTDYEFTVVLDIVHSGHFALASKDRTGIFTGHDPQPITEETGRALLEWLNSGAEPAPAPKPAPEPEIGTDPGPAIGGGAQQALPEWLEELCQRIENCDTKELLAVAWGKAKTECQKRNDTGAYQLLKDTMERTAQSIKEATEAAA